MTDDEETWLEDVRRKIGPHEYVWTGRSPDTCAVTWGDQWCGLSESNPIHHQQRSEPVADFTSRTVTVTRTEYVLGSPTNWVEVEKLLAALRRRLQDRDTYDDTVTVEARDDEIVFWTEERNAH